MLLPEELAQQERQRAEQDYHRLCDRLWAQGIDPAAGLEQSTKMGHDSVEMV